MSMMMHTVRGVLLDSRSAQASPSWSGCNFRRSSYRLSRTFPTSKSSVTAPTARGTPIAMQALSPCEEGSTE